MRNTMLAVITLALTILAQPNPMIPTDGLLARYDFTAGSLEDGSGNGRTLQNLAGTSGVPVLTADRDLSPNSAYHWQGTASNPFMRDDAGMPTGAADRSICVWTSLTSWDSCQYIVSWGLTRWGEPNDNSFSLAFLRDSVAILQGSTRLAGVRVTHAEIPADGTYDEPWAHVAVTIEGTTVKFFLDGALKATLTVSSLTTASDNTKLMVGGRGYHNIEAKLDEVLIYDRALTDNEVLNIHEPQVSVARMNKTIRRHAQTARTARFSLNGKMVKGALKPGIAARILYK